MTKIEKLKGIDFKKIAKKTDEAKEAFKRRGLKLDHITKD